MGTKNDPGAFDCYAAAHPNEPMFVLLARDELAPHLVRVWAALRGRDYTTAAMAYSEAIALSCVRDKRTHPNKIREAIILASEMEVWRRGQKT